MENKKTMDFEMMRFDKVMLPQYSEVLDKNKGWVKQGVDNLYPKYIQSLFQKAPLHSSIIRKKSRMIGGYGFSKTNLTVKTMLFLKNSTNELDLDQILYRCAYDMEIYGGFALNLVWSKDRSHIAEVNYIDVSKVRVQCPDEDHKYPQIENLWYCDGWENTRKFEPVLYQGFSTRSKKKASQIWYIKEQSCGQEYYALPEYLSIVRWLELDFKISDFHLANVTNGMAPSYIVQWPIGNASDEEKQYLSQRFKQEFTNSFNAGQVALSFVNDKDDVPTFTPVELNDSDGRFLVLKDQIRESILEAHQVESPILFGVEVPGKLGGRNERLEALEAFQNSYMTPKQNTLEKVFNRIARINGVTDNLIINRYSESFRNVDTDFNDVIELLKLGNTDGTLTSEQIYWVLVQNGYTHEIASKLSLYDEGNVRNPIAKTPTPSINPSGAPTQESTMSFNKIWDVIKYSNQYLFSDEDGDIDIIEYEKFIKEELESEHKEYLNFSNQKEKRYEKFRKVYPSTQEYLDEEIQTKIKSEPFEWQ